MNTRQLSAAGTALGIVLLVAGCAAGGGDSVTGTWGQEDNVHLTLATDGTLSGSDGCNRLSGGWEETAGEIDFGEVATTLMACEDVDTWLGGLASGEVSGDTMSVYDQSGNEIGTLTRS